MKNANPVYWCSLALAATAFALAGCWKQRPSSISSIPPSPASENQSASPTPVRYTYEIVAAWPHDRAAFTQGLVFRNGSFLESTGLIGRSSLREVDPKTGRATKLVTTPAGYFAEGLAVLGDRAFQLTWQNQRGFIYHADTFQPLGQFSYDGEGWGLTTDGRSLILSDGSSRLRFLDPENFAVVRTLEVTREGQPQARLNELEFIHGEIFANVWQTDQIVRIDPATGVVRGVIDLSGLLPGTERARDTDVLNGIAYDSATDRLFVTGKNWPFVYEVRLKPAP